MMAPLESFLLTQMFEGEQHGDGVHFYSHEWPGDYLPLVDDEPDRLLEAIEKTKHIDPELCADVKMAMQTNDDAVHVNCYTFGGYCRVFQGMIRRSGGKLPYVSTRGVLISLKYDQMAGMAELVTADAIESVSTFNWAQNRLVELGLEEPE
jgi:hypothetical protein